MAPRFAAQSRIMDALSDVLADVRIRDAVFVRTRLGARGRLQVAEAGQPCFHLVTEGQVWLHPLGDDPPLLLGPGDVAFVPQGQAHVLSGSPQPGSGGVDLLRRWREPEASVSSVVRAPDHEAGGWQGRTLSGCMHIDRSGRAHV